MSEPTQDTLTDITTFHVQGYHLLWPFFPERSVMQMYQMLESYNPPSSGVWASPVSLVTTKGISIDLLFPATEIFQFADLPPYT